jgi:hypothetical protein
MKSIVVLAALLAPLAASLAQEKLPREECLKYAFIACANLKQMLDTPIPTDPDVKRPVAVRDEGYGGMVLPESKLSAETFSKAGKEVAPVGQFWMVKLVPTNDGQPVPAARLRRVHLANGNQEAEAVVCALGVRAASGGGLELLIYGKDKEPVAHVPLKAISSAQKDPIDLSAERQSEGGLITLKFLGKYEASFMVTDPDQ